MTAHPTPAGTLARPRSCQSVRGPRAPDGPGPVRHRGLPGRPRRRLSREAAQPQTSRVILWGAGGGLRSAARRQLEPGALCCLRRTRTRVDAR
jgi:hypothetical protein